MKKLDWLSLPKRVQRQVVAGVWFLMAQLLCFGMPAAWADPHPAGGLVTGAKIIAVSNLNDSGPGSLRAALEARGPRVVVFEVAGIIRLQSNVTLIEPQLTLAGETAPSPGIILTGGSFNIRTKDAVISHIAVYPGSADDRAVGENRDAMSFFGSDAPGKHRQQNIVLRNVSLGWGVDENLGIQGLTDNLQIDRALIAQPLLYGGHPKGKRAMNLLLGNPVGRVVITGSVLASGNQRSARFTQGNRVSFVNNLIYGPGMVATHVDSSQKILNPGAIDIIGNVYVPNTDTNCKLPLIRIDPTFFIRQPLTPVYLEDNISIGPRAKCLRGVDRGEVGLSAAPAHRLADWSIRPAATVYPAILDHAGSHPAARNPVDRRVIAGIRDNSLRMINQESDVGGMPDIAPVRAPLRLPVPVAPLADEGTVARLKAYLCERHRVVTGGLRCAP